MDKLVDILFKDDLLKSYHALLGAAREPESKENLIPLSLSMLVVLAALLSVSKSLYGDAEFTLAQHFTGTAALLLSVYLLAGFLFVPFFSLEAISRYAITFFVCLLTASVFYLTIVLLFGFFTTGILDALDTKLPDSIRDSWVVITVEEWMLALLFGFFACAAVFTPLISLRRAKLKRLIPKYIACFAITTVLFQFFVIDRGGFFDNAMRLMSKVKL